MSFVRNVFGGLLGRQAVEDAAEHPAAPPPPPPPHQPLHVVFECAFALSIQCPACADRDTTCSALGHPACSMLSGHGTFGVTGMQRSRSCGGPIGTALARLPGSGRLRAGTHVLVTSSSSLKSSSAFDSDITHLLLVLVAIIYLGCRRSTPLEWM